METRIIKPAVAAILLVVLDASLTLLSKLSSWYTHRPLACHRKRRNIMRAMAGGVMLR